MTANGDNTLSKAASQETGEQPYFFRLTGNHRCLNIPRGELGGSAPQEVADPTRICAHFPVILRIATFDLVVIPIGQTKDDLRPAVKLAHSAVNALVYRKTV